MGWWRTDSGALLGDGPADEVGEHLERLSRSRKLRVEDLVGAIELVLRTKANDLLAPGQRLEGSLVADIETSQGDCVRVVVASPTDSTIRDAVDALCDAITTQYQVDLDRRPAIEELLGSLSFVLGHRADRFLAVPEAATVRLSVVPPARRAV